MSLEKSELFEPVETIETENTFDAAPVRETISAPAVQVQREPPRKRYAPPSAPRVMKFMLPSGSADTAPRVKA